MNLKSFYTLSDIRSLDGSCPCCNKRQLHFDPLSGRFACFGSDCLFRGRVVDVPVPANETEPEVRPEWYKPVSSDVAFAEYLPVSNCPSDMRAVTDYLLSLHIDPAAACRARCVTATVRFAAEMCTAPAIGYAYRVNGTIVNVKYRSVVSKMFTQIGKSDDKLPSVPYNIDCINPLLDTDPSTLIITEGEKDVLSLLSCGFRVAISVPNGSQCKPEDFFSPFLPWLDAVRRVIICGDDDMPGDQLKRTLTRFFLALGKRVGFAVMSVGCKDISDVLLTYGKDEVVRVIDSAYFPPIPDVVRVRDVRTDVGMALLGPTDTGYSLGFGEYFDLRFRLRDTGGLIIITGRPNSGKTDWLRCVLTSLVYRCDKRVAFLSFEEPDLYEQLADMARIAMGMVNRDELPSLMDCHTDYLDSHVCHFTCEHTHPTPSNILRKAELLSDEFPIDFLVIDPYLYLEPDGKVRENETQNIKSMLITFRDWAIRHRVWVFIVAHPRKPGSESKEEFEDLTAYQIADSAHWANIGDFVFSVRRVEDKTIDSAVRINSFTRVTALKVRYQKLCKKGDIFFLRQSYGRYDAVADQEVAALGVRDGYWNCDPHSWLPIPN